MGFFGIGTPKWRHKDPSVRRAALEKIPAADEHILVRMALEDPDEGLRAAAASKVASESNLKRLAAATDPKVVAIVRSRLAGVGQKVVHEGRLADVRGLLTGIKEHSALAELACTANDPAVRVAALDHLLGLAEPSPTALATVAIQDTEGSLAERALARITKRGILKDIARKAKTERVRTLAQASLDKEDATERQPSVDKRRKTRRVELEALIPRFTRVVVATDLGVAQNDFDLATATFDDLLAADEDLGEDDATALVRQRQTQAQKALDALRQQAAERAESERDAFVQREAFIVRITDGTEAGDRAALESSWAALTAVPFAQTNRLDARFAEAIASRFKAQVGTGYRVLDEGEAKELADVAAEAERLVAAADTRDSKPAEFRFQDLHKRWTALTHGCDPQLADRVRFTRAWDDFKARRRAARDARKHEGEQQLARLRELVAQAETYAATPVADDQQQVRFNDLKHLRADWRAVGRVRGGDELRVRFDRAVEAAFEPLEALREAEEWERFANVAKAEALTAEVNDLATIEDLPAVARRVKDAHRTWKELGPLPRDRQRDLWQAFKVACDTQFDRCKVHFAELDAKRATAKVEKERILAEAERLLTMSSAGLAGSPADRAAKESAADQLKVLQAAWKAAGAAPRDDDERLWQAFRTTCDKFFQGFHAVRDQEFQQNLSRKEAILTELEKLAATATTSTDVGAGERERWLRTVRDMQGRWRDIGYVPRERQDDVTRRMRTACDAIYGAARTETDEGESEQAENLAAKQDLCARLEALAGTADARADAEQLRLRWEATGSVPSSERRAVEDRWRTAWDALGVSGAR